MQSTHQKVRMLNAAFTIPGGEVAFHLAFALSKLARVTSKRNDTIPRKNTWAANAACQRRMVISAAILLAIVSKAVQHFTAIATWSGLPGPTTTDATGT